MYSYTKAFLAVARELNFTKAGQRLGLTQAAISRQIKLLEEEVGEELLVRSPQSVLLTSRGKEYFDLWSAFEEKMEREFFGRQHRVLKIGVIEGVLSHWLTPHIRELFLKGLNVEVYLDRTKSLISSLEKGQVDLVLSAQKVTLAHFKSLSIFKENYLLISPLKTKLRWPEAVIIYSDSDPLAGQGDHYLQVNSIREMIRLVEEGLGKAVIPAHALPPEAKVQTGPWKNESGQIYLTFLKQREESGVIQDFLQQIRRVK